MTQKSISVPFIDEVEEFNTKFGKLNNYKPTIPSKADCDFVYNFVIEEVNELKEAYESKDIVGVLDALLDLLYVATANGAMVFGLKDKIIPAFAEVQRSNMSKACLTEEEAQQTVEVRSKQQGSCHYVKVGEVWIVYRTVDTKAMKSINYSPPDLKQFFTEEELKNI